ncbi:MAG: energy transducer TonB [Thermoflexibacter sp.]|nr:energy transducer TonB [Thermoflexibacter sp.]
MKPFKYLIVILLLANSSLFAKNYLITTTIHKLRTVSLDTPKVKEKPLQKVDSIKSSEENIFTVAEENAEPHGGIISFYDYINKNLKYPKLAKKNKVEGRVYIQFIVNTDGSLSDIKVVKGIGAGCDEEAERLMKNAPAWKPAKQRGKLVKQRMVLPIIFRL